MQEEKLNLSWTQAFKYRWKVFVIAGVSLGGVAVGYAVGKPSKEMIEAANLGKKFADNW